MRIIHKKIIKISIPIFSFTKLEYRTIFFDSCIVPLEFILFNLFKMIERCIFEITVKLFTKKEH